ncbi:hypothetical protein HK096_001894, partial [Nowakowskiella sp. JEL0078]
MHQIDMLRGANVSWKVIALTLRRPEGSLRVWWSKNHEKLKLLPKPKITKLLTSGRVGLQIKQITMDQSKL